MHPRDTLMADRTDYRTQCDRNRMLVAFVVNQSPRLGLLDAIRIH
jgi:hypothetical protein